LSDEVSVHYSPFVVHISHCSMECQRLALQTMRCRSVSSLSSSLFLPRGGVNFTKAFQRTHNMNREDRNTSVKSFLELLPRSKTGITSVSMAGSPLEPFCYVTFYGGLKIPSQKLLGVAQAMACSSQVYEVLHTSRLCRVITCISSQILPLSTFSPRSLHIFSLFST
jgi:hypothetical protein